MRFISLLIAFVFSINTTLAGLPPTTAKGQQDTSAKTTFNFQVPNKQATSVAGATLLETGNKNILQNPSFEDKTIGVIPGWTQTGIFSANNETTVVIDGKQSLDLNVNNRTMEYKQDSTLYAAQFADGVQGLAMMRVKTSVTDTPIYVCPRTAGAYPSQMTSGCKQVQANGKWGLYKVPFILGGTSNGIGITSNGVAITGDVYIDDAFVGAADLKQDFSPVGPMVSYGAINITATTTAPTKATTREKDDVSCRVNGQYYECVYEYRAASATGSAVGSGGYIFNLPSGVAIDTNYQYTTTNRTTFSAYDGLRAAASIGFGDVEYTGNGDTGGKCDVYATSSTTFQANCFFGGTNNWMISSVDAPVINQANAGIKFQIRFRGAGLSSNYSAYSTTNANYSRVAYTPTFTGFGAVSVSDCYHSRDGQYLDIDCKFTAGASPAAVEAQISLPVVNGAQLTSATSTGIRGAGHGSASVANATYFSLEPLIESNVSYLTLGIQNSTTSSLTKINGNAFAGGTVFSFNARIPISAWDNSNIIIGQFNEVMTTPGVTKPKTCYYGFGGTSATITSPTVCAASPCIEVFDTCGVISPPTRLSAGNYGVLTITNGTFAPNSPIKFECAGYATSNQARDCYNLFNTAQNTWSSNSSGGFVTDLFTGIVTGTGTDAYVILKVEGQAP